MRLADGRFRLIDLRPLDPSGNEYDSEATSIDAESGRCPSMLLGFDIASSIDANLPQLQKVEFAQTKHLLLILSKTTV